MANFGGLGSANFGGLGGIGFVPMASQCRPRRSQLRELRPQERLRELELGLNAGLAFGERGRGIAFGGDLFEVRSAPVISDDSASSGCQNFHKHLAMDLPTHLHV